VRSRLPCRSFVVSNSIRLEVKGENTRYTAEEITSQYVYEKNHVQVFGDEVIVTPKQHHYTFKTQRKVPKVCTHSRFSCCCHCLLILQPSLLCC
jgi:hypothetical protein